MTGRVEQDHEARREGLASGVVQSLKDHVDERLRSPFGGAFVLSWLVVNWKGVAVMLLSDLPVEERIKQATTDYVDWYSGLLLPVGLALTFTFGFYVVSSVFVFLVEAYELAKCRIQRWYDDKTWVPPERYVALKVRLNGQIRYLQDLAADNIDAVENERIKTTEATDRLLKVQTELAQLSGELARAAEEKNEVLGELQKERKQRTSQARQADVLLKEKEVRERLTSELLNDVKEVQALLGSAKVNGHLDSLVFSLRDKLQAMVGGIESIPDGPLNEHSLAFYLKERFGLPVKTDLLRKLLEALEVSGLSKQVSTLSDVHEIINRAMPAMVAYRAERADLFTSSVDYFSKALGFVFPLFRSFHSYSKPTLNAFEFYREKVKEK